LSGGFLEIEGTQIFGRPWPAGAPVGAPADQCLKPLFVLPFRGRRLPQCRVADGTPDDYINDAEDAHYFLAAALEHGDLEHLIKAVGTVSRALGAPF
jgi:hypothetical protein